MDAHEDRADYQLVVIPRRPGDVWPLTSPYVEPTGAGEISEFPEYASGVAARVAR
jgi:hypothetical protein